MGVKTTFCLLRKKSLRKKKKRVIGILDLESNTEYKECKCLEHGKYKFEIFDYEGDGFIGEGYCKVYLNGKRKLKVKPNKNWFYKKKTLKIK